MRRPPKGGRGIQAGCCEALTYFSVRVVFRAAFFAAGFFAAVLFVAAFFLGAICYL